MSANSTLTSFLPRETFYTPPSPPPPGKKIKNDDISFSFRSSGNNVVFPECRETGTIFPSPSTQNHRLKIRLTGERSERYRL